MFSYTLALSDQVKNFAPRKGYLNLATNAVITQESFAESEMIHGISGPLGTYRDFFISAFYPSWLESLAPSRSLLAKYGYTLDDESDNPILFLHRINW